MNLETYRVEICTTPTDHDRRNQKIVADTLETAHQRRDNRP